MLYSPSAKALQVTRWVFQLFKTDRVRRLRRFTKPRPKTICRPPRVTIHDLPQDVIDHIIRLLRGNYRTLRACCLTRRAWVQQAQKEIHRAIFLDCNRVFPRSPDRYTSPHLAQNVLFLDAVMLPLPPIPDTPHRDIKEAQLLYHLFGRLTQLQHLTLTTTEWLCAADGRAHLMAAFPRVRSLRLADVRFRHVTDFLYFLSAFPLLERLRLDGVSWVHPPDEETANAWKSYAPLHALPGHRLRRISFGCWYAEFDREVASDIVRTWLARGAWAELEVEWHAREDVGALPELLAAVGPSLSYLQIGLRKGCAHGDPLGVGIEGIQHCTRLRSLVMRGSCSSAWNPLDEDFADGVFSWAPCVVREVPLRHLNYIGFSCALLTPYDLKRMTPTLRIVDKTLSTRDFQQLQEVSFSFETLSAKDVSRAVDLVWRHMPQTARRDLLSLYDRWDQQ